MLYLKKKKKKGGGNKALQSEYDDTCKTPWKNLFSPTCKKKRSFLFSNRFFLKRSCLHTFRGKQQQGCVHRPGARRAAAGRRALQSLSACFLSRAAQDFRTSHWLFPFPTEIMKCS